MLRILIVKTSSLGDILQAFPVATLIKKHFPDAIIDWAVEEKCQELVKANPLIANALVVNTGKWRKTPFSKTTFQAVKDFYRKLRENRYDVLFDLQGNTKSALITLAARAKKKVGFDKSSVPEWPNLLVTNDKLTPYNKGSVREAYLSLPLQYFNLQKEERLDFSLPLNLREQDLSSLKENQDMEVEGAFIVCPGSAWQNKKLSMAQWREILSNLNERFLVLWGSPSEKEEAETLVKAMPDKIKILPRLSLPALQHLMRRSKGVISMDSLPLHLAESAGVPSFGIFGPSSAKKYAPLPLSKNPALTEIIQGGCPYAVQFDKRCAKLRTCTTGACLKEMDTKAILMSLKRWMAAFQTASVGS